VDELLVCHEDADVRRSPRLSVEEDEIARLQIVNRDVLSDLELLLDLPRQRDAVLREHPLGKAAAVEACGIAAAIAIRCAAETERGRNKRVLLRSRRPRRSYWSCRGGLRCRRR